MLLNGRLRLLRRSLLNSDRILNQFVTSFAQALDSGCELRFSGHDFPGAVLIHQGLPILSNGGQLDLGLIMRLLILCKGLRIGCECLLHLRAE